MLRKHTAVLSNPNEAMSPHSSYFGCIEAIMDIHHMSNLSNCPVGHKPANILCIIKEWHPWD